MSWHFSRALVEAFSAATCSDGELSQQSNGSHTPQAYCSPGRMTACSRLSRFGMTFVPLTDDRCEALLTWFLAASRARTSASPEQARGSTASEAGCGHTWPASLAKYDPSSHTLKTAQLSFLEDLTGCSVTLPRWGTMRNGECYPRQILGRLTCESASGLWPTPTASAMPCEWTVRLCRQRWQDGSATLEEASAIAGRDVRKAQGKVPAMETFPTPTATQYKGWSPGHNRAESDDRLDYTIEREASKSGQTGRLNPAFTEWLMGWPLGWTDLKPLEMDRFLEWQQQHSASCARDEVGDVANDNNQVTANDNSHQAGEPVWLDLPAFLRRGND